MANPHTDREARVRAVGWTIARYAAAGGVASGAAALADALTPVPGWLRASSAAQIAGLGTLAGAFAGAKLALVLCALGALRPSRRVALSALAALGFAAHAVHRLGVLERLGGRYASLAWVALAGLVGFGAFASACVLALAPPLRDATLTAGAREPPAWLDRKPRRTRSIALGTLAVAALAMLIADRHLLIGTYPYIHEIVREAGRLGLVATLASAAFALTGRAVLVLLAMVAALGVMPLVTLEASHSSLLAAMRTIPLVDLSMRPVLELADLDGDGYASVLGGGDCAPFDADVNPGMPEKVANGIDDNCRLGDLSEAFVERPVTLHEVEPAAASPRPSIVLISVDSLRADHLGAYGYRRAVSPNIDAHFASGTRFENAMAAGSLTTISMPALLHGKLPRRLEWASWRLTTEQRLMRADRAALKPGESWLHALLMSDEKALPALAELLAARGARTAAVVDDGGGHLLAQEVSGAGFQHFEHLMPDDPRVPEPDADARIVTASRARLSELSARQEPFLLWIHFFGVHYPDSHHEGVREFAGDGLGHPHADGYDHEIANLDAQLGPLLRELEALEAQRPLITVLTSDHGEQLSSTDRLHGTNLVEEELRVPLMFRGQSIPRGVRKDVASLVDVVPTLLARWGLRTKGLDGVDLLASGELPRTRIVLADVWRHTVHGTLEFDRVAAVRADRRMVYDIGTNSERLYERGLRKPALIGEDPALRDAIARYLEQTGPRPRELLP